ncbi:hypothetical protein [Nocardia spumae]|uniref:hypothetical protein n=1 Tax=Nocardia spumae TaxID=2887190 RepID=UPI001D1527C3|nr:hypothetical protein [Nocardia spumae]
MAVHVIGSSLMTSELSPRRGRGIGHGHGHGHGRGIGHGRRASATWSDRIPAGPHDPPAPPRRRSAPGVAEVTTCS